MSNIFKSLRNASFLVVAAGLLVASCQKKNDASAVSQFVGTWVGKTCPDSTTGSITIKAGATNYSVLVDQWVGVPDDGIVNTCSRAIQLSGTISGNVNNNTFTMPVQNFTDLCTNTYTMSGGGSIVNDTLYINFITNGPNGSRVCNFKGHK